MLDTKAVVSSWYCFVKCALCTLMYLIYLYRLPLNLPVGVSIFLLMMRPVVISRAAARAAGVAETLDIQLCVLGSRGGSKCLIKALVHDFATITHSATV